MSDRRVPPPTKLPGLITTPMSWLYSIAISWKNRQFDAGKGVSRLDQPVISIGNLSTGGTGKTPMVHLIVGMLQGMGKHPVIAMRGYGAKPGEKGDEQLEHERALPGVPIVAQPDRLAGLRALFSGGTGGSYDCVVLDDGFQHRKIVRDLDIVLIDATRPPERDALLPQGHLREPIDSLSRASMVFLTHSERVDSVELERIRMSIHQVVPDLPVLVARHEWAGFDVYSRHSEGWSQRASTLEDALERVFAVVCGIGNPGALRETFEELGLEQSRWLELRDHAPLTESALGDICRSANEDQACAVLMTQKDWVKATHLNAWRVGVEVFVPKLRIAIHDDAPLRDRIGSLWDPPA